MTFEDLRTLLDYHYWARDRLLAALDPLSPEEFTRDLGSSFKSIRDTAAHIYAADWVWYERWQGHSFALPSADQFPDVASLRRAWSEHEEKMRVFVESLGEDGVNRVFAYKLLSGIEDAWPFWQMLHHVVNHATYHRGQVTTMLRQIGAKPPQSMDAIGY